MLGIIGGSGLYTLATGFELEETVSSDTPYGPLSSELLLGRWHGLQVAFLARHGVGHRVPPHRINYRANVWALKQAGVSQIIAVNAVGGIRGDCGPRTMVIPDQLIDYTSGRDLSFFDGGEAEVQHIDFSWPYSQQLRERLLQASQQESLVAVNPATYGCTNGPRLETAAEVVRLRKDGCDIVGMTSMPEAALAREMEMDYACLALVVNWAAGIQKQPVAMEDILKNMDAGMKDIMGLLVAVTGSLKS